MEKPNSSRPDYLLVGLGNPGLKYKKNRHNAGSDLVMFLCQEWHGSPWEKNKKCLAEISSAETENGKIMLAKPTIFMNESGRSVKKLKDFYRIPLKRIFVAQDDTDILLGRFKISYNRGSAGHHGIESIIDHLRSAAFYRIRIGVRPITTCNAKAEKLVLRDFTRAESEKLQKIFPSILEEINNAAKNQKI